MTIRHRAGAARRIGLSLDEYEAKRAAGLKWCWRCASWKPKERFPKDSSRVDGLNPACKLCTCEAKRSRLALDRSPV